MLAARYKHIDDFQTVSGMLLIISSNLCQSFYRNGIDYNTAVTVLGINYIQHFTQIAAAAAYENTIGSRHSFDVFQSLTGNNLQIVNAKQGLVLSEELNGNRVAMS